MHSELQEPSSSPATLARPPSSQLPPRPPPRNSPRRGRAWSRFSVRALNCSCVGGSSFSGPNEGRLSPAFSFTVLLRRHCKLLLLDYFDSCHLLACLLAFLLACLPACLPACLSVCLLACLLPPYPTTPKNCILPHPSHLSPPTPSPPLPSNPHPPISPHFPQTPISSSPPIAPSPRRPVAYSPLSLLPLFLISPPDPTPHSYARSLRPCRQSHNLPPLHLLASRGRKTEQASQTAIRTCNCRTCMLWAYYHAIAADQGTNAVSDTVPVDFPESSTSPASKDIHLPNSSLACPLKLACVSAS